MPVEPPARPVRAERHAAARARPPAPAASAACARGQPRPERDQPRVAVEQQLAVAGEAVHHRLEPVAGRRRGGAGLGAGGARGGVERVAVLGLVDDGAPARRPRRSGTPAGAGAAGPAGRGRTAGGTAPGSSGRSRPRANSCRSSGADVEGRAAAGERRRLHAAAQAAQVRAEAGEQAEGAVDGADGGEVQRRAVAGAQHVHHQHRVRRRFHGCCCRRCCAARWFRSASRRPGPARRRGGRAPRAIQSPSHLRRAVSDQGCAPSGARTGCGKRRPLAGRRAAPFVRRGPDREQCETVVPSFAPEPPCHGRVAVDRSRRDGGLAGCPAGGGSGPRHAPLPRCRRSRCHRGRRGLDVARHGGTAPLSEPPADRLHGRRGGPPAAPAGAAARRAGGAAEGRAADPGHDGMGAPERPALPPAGSGVPRPAGGAPVGGVAGARHRDAPRRHPRPRRARRRGGGGAARAGLPGDGLVAHAEAAARRGMLPRRRGPRRDARAERHPGLPAAAHAGDPRHPRPARLRPAAARRLPAQRAPAAAMWCRRTCWRRWTAGRSPAPRSTCSSRSRCRPTIRSGRTRAW